MATTVFICDEMEMNVSQIIGLLEEKDHSVIYYQDASLGLEYLLSCINEVNFPPIMLIDLAMNAGVNPDIFEPHSLDGGQLCGIALIQTLLDCAHENMSNDRFETLKKGVVLYTRVSEQSYVRIATEFARKTGIKFEEKRAVNQLQFMTTITTMLQG